MYITLERLDKIDYNEVTDFNNETVNLVIGCLDSVSDYLCSVNIEGNEEAVLLQLEYTMRAILDKYHMSLEDEVIGAYHYLFPNVHSALAEVLSNLAEMLKILHAKDDSVRYDGFLLEIATRSYRIVSGILQTEQWKRGRN